MITRQDKALLVGKQKPVKARFEYRFVDLLLFINDNLETVLTGLEPELLHESPYLLLKLSRGRSCLSYRFHDEQHSAALQSTVSSTPSVFVGARQRLRCMQQSGRQTSRAPSGAHSAHVS
jgi:hypothetical protein